MSDDVVALALIRHVRQTATCTVCKLPFRSPCLLPACLHTFCSQCIQQLDTCAETEDGSLSTVLCPLCSQESVLSSKGKEIAVKDYFANKLLESIGHLLGLNQYGGNYSHFCEFVKKLRDACECPVCQELCFQPCMLPCSHTFCHSCLEGCSANSRSFSYLLKCPLCRQLYSQPAEGFNALPTNKLLSRILDKLSEPEVRQLVSRLLDPENVDRSHCEVIGVAELHGHLYVLQNKSKSIHVSLATKPYSMLRDVPLDGAVEPTDLAASTFDNCIYVTAVGDGGCIWRVQVEERVSESSLQYVELKLDQNASELGGMIAESASASATSAQEYDGEVKQLTSCTDCSTASDGAYNATSEAEGVSVASIGAKQPVSQTQDEANRLREPLSRDAEQCNPTDINLQELLQMMSGSSEVSATNVTSEAQDKSEFSSKPPKAGRMKDKDDGEMIRSLLERTGLMKKISEHGSAGPCVFEVSRHYSVKRWVEGVRADAVSVGADGQVVLVTDTGHLVIYGVDGQLIVDHSLPDDVQKPRHAVFSVASGTFIVSHSSVNGAMHRVSELIMDPIASCLSISRSYGSTAGRLQQHLHWPRHLTVDERGWVFVADCGNDRVLLLDEKLRLKRVMLSHCDGVQQPWRLCFVPATGILAVGSVTGNVALYLVGGETKRNK